MKDRLTRKRALTLSIELWTWLAETGLQKYEWPGWAKFGPVGGDCFLCEYSGNIECDRCPYNIHFHHNCFEESAYTDWERARNKRFRKQHAAKFLNELKQIPLSLPRINDANRHIR